MGEQPYGTYVVPSAGVPAPKPPASATVAHPAGANARLVEEANCLVDAYAQVLERALNTYQGRVKPDEVRALLITSYIQRNKLSSVA